MCSCLTASACRLRMPLDAGRDPSPPKACCMTGEAAGTSQILGVAQVGHPEAFTLAPARSGRLCWRDLWATKLHRLSLCYE